MITLQPPPHYSCCYYYCGLLFADETSMAGEEKLHESTLRESQGVVMLARVDLSSFNSSLTCHDGFSHFYVTFLVFFNQSTLTLQIAWFVLFFFVSCLSVFRVCVERGKRSCKDFFFRISSRRLMKLVKTRIFYCLFYFYLPYTHTHKMKCLATLSKRASKRAVTNF